MSNNLTINAQSVPAVIRQRIAAGMGFTGNFTGGVRNSFPTLSIKGKAFSFRYSGETHLFPNPSMINVIMLNASPHLAKTYYIKGYTEGDVNQPDCWSLDSIRPDPSVPNKVSISCVNCKMNVFGSRVTNAGKMAKACQDARRVAVIEPHFLHDDDLSVRIMMVRVPQSSLKNLKNYAQQVKMLGSDPIAVVTTLSFDPTAAFPKLEFRLAGSLNEIDATRVLELADSPHVLGMLQTPDFDNAASPVEEGGVMAPLQQTPANVTIKPYQATVAPITPLPSEGTVITLPDGQRFDTATGEYLPEPVEEVVQQPAAVPDDAIELPDGRWYSKSLNAFVDKPAPPAPVLDPQTVTLPDGRFYQMAMKKYVTGPELGAPEIWDAAAPGQPATKRKAAAPAKKAAAAKPTANEAVTQVVKAAAAPVEKKDSGGNGGLENGGDAPSGSVVMASEQELDDLLHSVVPENIKM